ncbi:putative late blight resistance protein homolog R1A-10 [Andrographis paniculata]|uniref:putative late blight resistance protein homolog R1A-10 n=1 Tax=Andrographis paniculata TaxID=175694 RepID=UPI0021E8B133|nr:putative late blight resistance protein homolog R1A-10 [Andrographis paniculata]
MAAAAYAAILSLIHSVRRVQYRTSQISFYRCQIDHLEEMGCLFQKFLKAYSHGESQEQPDLERKIVDAAHEAEDAIDNCIADEILDSSRSDLLSHIELLERVKLKMKYIMELCVGLKDQQQLPSRSLPASSDHLAHHHLHKYSLSRGSKRLVVGLEIEQNYILECLTAGHYSLQVISIVGIEGIGKTTLVQSLYENNLGFHHFDIKIWITLCKECTLRDVLLQICSRLDRQESSDDLLSEDQLKVLLYKSLCCGRYLIILDDMTSLEIWGGLRPCFPDRKNMSRIILITRPSRMVSYFDFPVLEKCFLEEATSWELLCRTTFGIENCPNELQNIGRKIAQKCKGLPLSIIVIGGLLKNLPLIKDVWKSVARDLKPILNLKDYKSWFGILSLSYRFLPRHLKQCFLYLGIFPENYVIPVSQLIKLWIAQGFVQPDHDNRCLEEIGLDYLEDLVDRNLVLFNRHGLTGDMKTCYIHECVRDLCLWIAREENFFDILRNHCIVFREKNLYQEFNDAIYPSQTGTLICCGEGMPQIEDASLLRVVDDVDINSFEDIFQHANLRYIRCRSTSAVCRVPSTISNLWSLETIICHNTHLVSAPIEIWSMKHLRHVEFSKISVPDPPSTMGLPQNSALEHLQTFMKIVNFKCTDDVLMRIKRVKKLQIKYDRAESDYFLENMRHFPMLESLKVFFHVDSPVMKKVLLLQLTYPISLRKLSLDNIELCWKDLQMMAFLPNLEELKIKGNISRVGWSRFPQAFCSLKSLRIDGSTDIDFYQLDNALHIPHRRHPNSETS